MMNGQQARAIIVRAAEKIRAELPVCYGCPEGRFETSIEQWLEKLCNLARQATFLEWRVLSVGQPAIMFVLVAEQKAGKGDDPPVLEVPIARIDNGTTNPSDLGGSTRRLAIIGPEADEVGEAEQRPVEARDRIGELLEGQARLEAKVDHLTQMLLTRERAVLEMVQRAMILTNHYGRSPFVGTVDLPIVGERSIVLQRPDFKPAEKPEPKPEPEA